ncbi:MAG TPA: hypothetical protein VG711_10060 [Phycisphaerales bacterium]|nr:hypothetical protein [Phycisphaerales bacterium]
MTQPPQISSSPHVLNRFRLAICALLTLAIISSIACSSACLDRSSQCLSISIRNTAPAIPTCEDASFPSHFPRFAWSRLSLTDAADRGPKKRSLVLTSGPAVHASPANLLALNTFVHHDPLNTFTQPHNAATSPCISRRGPPHISITPDLSRI